MTGMILLLGATGYMGQAFSRELQNRGIPFVGLSRKEMDYTRFDRLWKYLHDRKPGFLINAAGFTGRPNVDACETARAETLLGNTLFPQSVANACLAAGVPYGHVSSGCIYNGVKVVENGKTRIEPDLNKPEVRELTVKAPQKLRGFTEEDAPNFSFRAPPCSFYSGTKALAEEAMAGVGQGYLWRLRMPFDEEDNPRNLLTKYQKYSRIYDNINSISHRGDFVKACLDLWQQSAPYGVYNIVNPGWVSTKHVIAMVQKYLAPGKNFEFWTDDSEFYKLGAVAPRSNCILDASKLERAGVKIRPVEEALEYALKNWKLATQSQELAA